MAYSEALEQRIKDHIGDHPAVVDKKMFGGVAFLLQHNMAVGVHKEDLMVRVGPDRHDDSLAQPGVVVFDISGRPMKGWILVQADAIADDDALSNWIEQGMDFAGSLPPK